MSAIVENAVGGLIASEVHGVIGLLVSRIKEEIKLAWGFEKELEKLKERFEELSGILEGTSGQSVSNQVMARRLKKIKYVAEDVDIMLDECSYKALQDKIIGPQKWYKKICRRLVMAHKVNDMTKAVDSIYNHADRLCIELVKVGGGELYSGMHSHEIEERKERRLLYQRRFVDEKSLHGREEDITKILDSLHDAANSHSDDFNVIGVVGMAGVGKTALIKHISKLEEVTEYFQPKVIWLVVSHNFDLINMLNKMGEQLFENFSKMETEAALISKLQEKLRGKKYLLVLDDVWDTIHWESLKITLQDIGGSQGTTLLVTSRDQDVVEKMETRSKSPKIHVLRGLRECDSWSLFEEILGKENLVGNENKEIAKRMMDKCGGVPLAIRVLADLLRGKRIEKWREIEESEMWTKEDKYDILPSLRLSYNYLPYPLKKCFAFCAIFEEDAVIKKQELMWMWMAQGFLQPIDKMELEGEEYIEHLLNRSLLQDAHLDIYGNVYAFKMHDLVWSLARVVSEGECLSSYRDDDDDLDKVRHLLVSNNSVSRELTATYFKKLQTCMLNKEIENPSLHIWLKCKQLRILAIGRNWSHDTDWKPLGKLIHLRYFEITADREKDVKHFNLPDQITKLYHLQTLVIHIHHFENPSNTLFPKGLRNLVNLRHILTKFTLIAKDVRIGIPVGLSHLTALQTLPVIDLELNWGGARSDVGLLTNLRGKLEINSLRSLTDGEEARSLGLGSKSNLDSLVLQWPGRDNRGDQKNPKANEIVEALQPHENLHKLQLRFFDGTAFPKWLMGPGSPLNNIVSLQISDCEEADGDLKLENFICLRILKVSNCKKLTVTFPNNKSQCCKSLEELLIACCDKVEELPDLFLMPKLQVIEIWDNNSTSRDVLVGLGSLTSLRKLDTDLKLPVDLGEESPVCKSLKHLTLDGSKYYKGDTTTDLPDQLQHLVALQILSLRHFESVEAIPNWLGKLTSLQGLSLWSMPKLKQLPPQDVMRRLSNLTSFHCSGGCPLLEEDIKNKRGEWFKIAHIRCFNNKKYKQLSPP